MKRRFILLITLVSLILLMSLLLAHATLSEPRFLILREPEATYYKAQRLGKKPSVEPLNYTGTSDTDVIQAVEQEDDWIKANQPTYLINAIQNNVWNIEYGNETYYGMSAIHLPSEDSNTQFTILESAPPLLGILSLGWGIAAGLTLAIPRIFTARKRAIPVIILTLLTLALLFSQIYAFISQPRFLILRGSEAVYYRAQTLEEEPSNSLNYTGSTNADVMQAVKNEARWWKAEKATYLISATRNGTWNININETYYSMSAMYSHSTEGVDFTTIDSIPYLSGGFTIVLAILGLAFAMPRTFIPCKHKATTPDGLFKMCKKLNIMPLYRSHCKKCKHYES